MSISKVIGIVSALWFSCLCLATTCQSNGRFYGDLVVKQLEDGVTFELQRAIKFQDAAGSIWDVPKGSRTNGASVPRWAWSIIPPLAGKHLRASALHDHYCVIRTRDSSAVHRVFYDALRASGVGLAKAKLMYYAVLRFGPQWGRSANSSTQPVADSASDKQPITPLGLGTHAAGRGASPVNVHQALSELQKVKEAIVREKLSVDELEVMTSSLPKPGSSLRQEEAPSSKQRIAPPVLQNQRNSKESDQNNIGLRKGEAENIKWPVIGPIHKQFGKQEDGTVNSGITISVKAGTDIHAAESGEVAYAGSELSGFGNLILIRHSNGYITAYAHLKRMLVSRGDIISRGQIIAKAGKIGDSTLEGLYFELRNGDRPIDPIPYFNGNKSIK